MPKIIVPKNLDQFLQHDKAARNACIPDAEQVLKLAYRTNAIAGRRFKRLWSKFIPGTDAYSAVGASTLWRGVFHTSPNVGDVRVQVIARGSENLGTAHYYEWTVGGVPQGRRYVIVDETLSGPTDYYYGATLRLSKQRFVDGAGEPLAGNTQYEFSLEVNDGCRVVGATIYEATRSQLDTDIHTAVRVDPLAVGSPVLSREIADMHHAAWHIWQKQGPVHVAWSNEDITPPTQTGTTYRNLIDATTTGYSASASGQWLHGAGHHRFFTNTMSCLFWCYASTDAGSNGRVRFTGSSGTLATITGIGTTPQIYSTVLNITAADSLVVLEHSNSNAGQTTTTHAAGFYELDT